MDLFSEICLDSDSESASEYLTESDSDVYFTKPKIPLNNQRFHQPPLKPIDFMGYIRDNCENKVKILKRSTFSEISKPIIICFNHFLKKCAYHTTSLDKLYQLALKYVDNIEIIAADIEDIDIMNLKLNSIYAFWNLTSPEKESGSVFAIDQRKRVHQLYKDDQTLEKLIILCEELLNDKLFISEPIPEPNNSSLVKICVHDNYNEVVINSPNHILLIVNLGDYNGTSPGNQADYEIVARELKSSNIDVVYMNSNKNDIPFELDRFCYSTLLLIPQNDKTQHIDFLKGPKTTENIVHCLKSYLKDPKTFLCQQDPEFCKYKYKPLEITADFNMDFKDLPQYLLHNCHYNMKVFERKTSMKTTKYMIITFLDFSSGKCSAQHLKWIDEIYQVASSLSGFREYFIADYKDIDEINPQWKPQDFIPISTNEIEKPTVIGVDLKKNKFALKDFKTIISLFYFSFSLSRGELYFSEPWPTLQNEEKLVKTCIADNLNFCISSVTKNIFLAIYFSKSGRSEEFLLFLEKLAVEVKKKKFSLKMIKIDARFNYIPLEMADTIYPILYFIPQTNKDQRIRFRGDYLDKEDILNFISKNVKETEKEEN